MVQVFKHFVSFSRKFLRDIECSSMLDCWFLASASNPEKLSKCEIKQKERVLLNLIAQQSQF